MNKPDTGFMVGVGGWAYLPIKRGNKLEVCSKLYDFVEVNSTFYTLPELERVKKWKKTVPTNFEFTLRANRELTHAGHLKPTQKNFKIFEKMRELAKELASPIIHFQFPPSLTVTEEVVADWDAFFSSIYSDRLGLNFAIETRSQRSDESPELARLIQDYNIIPCADASKDQELRASIDSQILYTRVFGPGDHTKWSFDTNELQTLADKVTEVKARKRYVTFHNLTMYEDASRMKTVASKGKDQKQPPNAPLGFESLKRVIASGRMKYPVNKQKLIDEFGWKTFDLEQEKKEHVSDELNKLEADKSFDSLDDLLDSLMRTKDDSTI